MVSDGKKRNIERKYAAFDKLPAELRAFYREQASDDLDPSDALTLSQFQTPEQVIAPIRTQMEAKAAKQEDALRNFPAPGSVYDRAVARSRRKKR